MLASLLVLLAMPLLDTGRVRGGQFRPLWRVSFWALVSLLVLLMYIGSQHAEEPYVTLGAVATFLYFAWYFVLTPLVGLVENTLADLAD
jgi:quinol-cytochrome oxidoreductase complex cytochrome b subunit